MESATKLPRLASDMAKFDIITAAGNAYKTSWASRRYLLRLAAVPVALKLIFFTIASIYAGGTETQDGNYMLFMLILVPALIAEGWMLAHWVRFIVLGQTWPFRPTGNIEADKEMLSTRARGILSGMIVFVLINMAIGFLNDTVARAMEPYMSLDMEADVDKIPPIIPVFSIFFLAFMFWGFRLMWLHIPYALNMSAGQYLTRLKGATSSIYMIGVWIFCFVPFILILKFIGPIFIAGLPGQAGTMAVTLLSILLDTVKSIIVTAGITFGLKEIFSGKDRVDRRV